MIKFFEHVIRFFDISRFNDEDNATKPDLSKMVGKVSMVAVRVGYGIVKDVLFDYYWKLLKTLGIPRKPYWYLDYYSHKHTGMTAREWGIEQAEQCWDILKNDPGECPLTLDEENSPNCGYKVTVLNSGEYNVISRAFLERWYELSGSNADIYCSLGWLPILNSWHRKFDLWLAWYNEYQTVESVKAAVAAKGWIGKVLFWQYASHGDTDGDGVGNGLEFGTEYKTIDLNIGVEIDTLEKFSIYCGKTPAVVPATPTDEDQVIYTGDTSGKTRTIRIATVVNPGGLNIRNVPLGLAGSKVLAWMEPGHEVELLDKKTIGSNIWHRCGQDQWCTELYNGYTFLK